MDYLEKYHQRRNPEANFAVDKLGWGVVQIHDDRIGCALFSMELWHNLFNLKA